MRAIFHFFIGLTLLLFAPGIASALGRFGATLLEGDGWMPLAAGAAVGLLVARFIVRYLPAVDVFEHELTHLLAGLLFLQVPTKFVATGRRGGIVRMRGRMPRLLQPFGIDFITLAPYVVPTYALIAVGVRPLLGAPLWFDVVVGMTFGYHFSTGIRETFHALTIRRFESADGIGEMRSDIAQAGFVFSLMYIPVVSLAMYSVLIAVLAHGYAGIPLWARHVWKLTAALAASLAKPG